MSEKTIQATTNGLWDEINKKFGYTSFPNEMIVIWVARNFGAYAEGARRALDIGFGSLANIDMLQRFGFQCAGVEASPEAVKAANALSESRGQQVELRLFNEDGSLPFPDDYFDLVISSHAIYHGLDMALTKREVRRVLKDGSRFLFDFWDPESEEMRGTEVVQSTEARSLGIVMRTKNPESELFGVSRLVYPNRQLLLDEFQHDFENVKVEKNSYDVAGHYTSWLYVSGKVRKEKKGKKYVETQYLDYQERYAVEPRRTDVRLIELIERECNSRPPDDSRQLKLLDLGCSSGNLLYHLRNRLPRLRYTGADVFPGIIEHCSQNPRLAGMDFHVLDVRKFDNFPSSFDFITVNAVLHRFDRATLLASLQNIANALAPDGVLYLFEFCHEFEQNIVIDERQSTHPEGARLHIWSRDEFDAVLSEAGLSRGQYFPFEIDIDLPRPTRKDDITTYTVNTVEGGRLQLRGSLLMPWCHIVCKRA